MSLVTDSTVAATLRSHSPPDAATAVEIVVPVHNEERGLEASIRALHGYLTDRFPVSWAITIADNASTDARGRSPAASADELDGVRGRAPRRQGPGPRAAHGVVGEHAAVVAYMDVDLSTDLDALLPLVAPLCRGHSDVAIGTRLAPAHASCAGRSARSSRAATT